jgi:hypothetical protein
VVVPGNHDVCWNTAFSSMGRVPEAEYPNSIPGVLAEPESAYRWNWKERALYQICDPAAYARRLDDYWDLVEHFYDGIPLAIPLDRHRGFQLFALDSGRIVVAAFESLHGNDCFGLSGALAGGAVGRCYMKLRGLPYPPKLRIAVWHHSVQGPPRRVDYMDVGEIQEMAGHGFQLGLHGHQHVAAAATHYIHLGESLPMAVVSAGSLCAGSRDLPRGVDRQYNLVVIDDDYRRARVHVREMTEGGHFTRKNDRGFAQGYVEVDWQPPLDAAGREIDDQLENQRRVTMEAEALVYAGKPKTALALLARLTLEPGSHARRLALEAARLDEDWARTKAIIGAPGTTEEAVLLIKALEALGELDRAEEVLKQCGGIDAATRQAIGARLDVLRRMRGT